MTEIIPNILILNPSPKRRRKEKSVRIFLSGFFFLLLPSPLLGERRYRGEDVFDFFVNIP
jgi:hypothetical protein